MQKLAFVVLGVLCLAMPGCESHLSPVDDVPDGRPDQPAVPDSITVTGHGDTLVLPDSVHLHAIAYSKGKPLSPPPSFKWASEQVAIATVDSQGLVRAVAPGRTCVAATAASAAGGACLNVERYAAAVAMEGHYAIGFESSVFQPCGSGDRWWVTQTPAGIAEFMAGKPEFTDRLTGQSPSGRVFVRWRIRVSKPGIYGHMGLYRFEATVDSLTEVRVATSLDCQ